METIEVINESKPKEETKVRIAVPITKEDEYTISNLNEQIGVLQGKISRNNNEIARNNSEIASLDSANTDYTSQIAGLEAIKLKIQTELDKNWVEPLEEAK